jgi:hypothetical protein
LKGGSPTRVNPNFLQSYLARHNEGVEPYFVEAAQMEFAAYSQGKSLRVYAEEQRRPLSLEEVLERIEGQSGGRRKRHHKRKTHRKRGRSYTRRHRRRRSYH